MRNDLLENHDLLPAAGTGQGPEFDQLRQAVAECLGRGCPDEIAAYFASHHPADVAAFVDRLDVVESCALLGSLPLPFRSAVFGYLPPSSQMGLARCLGRAEFAALVAAMSPDERADLFNQLSDEQKTALLPGLAQAAREDIRRLAAYGEQSAGALMTSDYATLRPDLTVAQAIEQLRREAPDRETIYDAFVIDSDRRLLGLVRLRDLILAEPDTIVSDLMVRNVISGRATEDQEVIAGRIARYDLSTLPILDAEGRLVGIVTHDDALDVMEEETTEDFHRAATVQPLPGRVGELAPATLYRKRISWLVLLVFANLLSGAGIALYEDTVAANIALVFFLPLLIASGGNAGSQASTLMVRAIATGEVRPADWARLLGREVLVAGALGLTMALAVGPIGLARGGAEIMVVVAATMVLVVLAGSLIGLSLPFILNRLRMDPATASGPLVTSIADVVGVLTYFAIATAILF